MCRPATVSVVLFVLVKKHTFGVCSGRPRSVYGAVSLWLSLVVEGTLFVRGNRGLLPVSTSVRVLFFPPSPEHMPPDFGLRTAVDGRGR